MRTRQRVERAERLVQQQHLRLHRQRAGNADALLHAAGDFGRPLVLGMRHLHEVEIVHHPGVALGAALGFGKHLVDAELDVLVDSEPRQQAVVLEHHGAVRPRRIDLAVFQEHAAIGGAGETGDDVEQRRLAAAGVADDRDVFALVDRQVDLLQHLGRGIAAGKGLVDVVELQIGLHDISLQLTDVPWVTTLPSPAIRRSSTKPMMPT